MTIDERGYTTLTWAALAVALLATAGSLGLSLGLGLRACPLCFYQRSFVMAVAGVLLLGLLLGQPRHVSLLALPLAVAGLGVAIFHVWLELDGQLECPRGFFELGTAPQQSLAALAPLSVLLLIDVLRQPRRGPMVAALVMGLLFAWGCVVSSPPLPPVPSKPYDPPFDICRRPYVPG